MIEFDIIAYYNLNSLALQVEGGELNTEGLEAEILKRISSKPLRNQVEFKASFQTLIALLNDQGPDTRPELIHLYVHILVFLCERYSRIISRGESQDYIHTGLGFEVAFIHKWNLTLINLLQIRTNLRLNHLTIKALLVSLDHNFQPNPFTLYQIKLGIKYLEVGALCKIIAYILYCLESNLDNHFKKLKSLVISIKNRIAEEMVCIVELITGWKMCFNRLWSSLINNQNTTIRSSQFLFIHNLVIQVYTVANLQFASQSTIFEPISRLALKSFDISSLTDKFAWLNSSALEPSKLLLQLIRTSYYSKYHDLIVFLTDKIWSQTLAILLLCWESLIKLEFNEQVDIEKYYMIISRLLDIIKLLTILNPIYPDLSNEQKETILLNGVKMFRYLDILSELHQLEAIKYEKKPVLYRLELHFDTVKDGSSFTKLLTTCLELVGGILVRNPILPTPTARSRFLHCVYTRFEDLMVKQGFVEAMLLRLARVPLILNRNIEVGVRDLEYNLVKCLELFWRFEFGVNGMHFIKGTNLGPIFNTISRRIELSIDMVYGETIDIISSMTNSRLVNIAINSLKHHIFYKFIDLTQLSNLVLKFPLIDLIQIYTNNTPTSPKLGMLIKNWLQKLKCCILQNSIQSNLIKGDRFSRRFIKWLLNLLKMVEYKENIYILEVIGIIFGFITDKTFDYSFLEQLVLISVDLKELDIGVTDLPEWLQGGVKCKDKTYSIYFIDLITTCMIYWFPLHTKYEGCECSKAGLRCILLPLIDTLDRLASVQAFKLFTLHEFRSVWGRNLVDLTVISSSFDRKIKNPRCEINQIMLSVSSFLIHSLDNSNNFLKAVQCGKIFELCFPLVANSYLYSAWYDNQTLKSMLIKVNRVLGKPLINYYMTQVQTNPRGKATELAYHSILLITRLGQIRDNLLVSGTLFDSNSHTTVNGANHTITTLQSINTIFSSLKVPDNIRFPLLENMEDCEVLRYCMILQATVLGDNRFPFNFSSNSSPLIDCTSRVKLSDKNVQISSDILDLVNDLNPIDLMTPRRFNDPVTIRVQGSVTERILISSKVLLMHISPVFYTMLTQDFVEGRTQVIKLEEETYTTINFFITQLTSVYEKMKTMRVVEDCRQLTLAEVCVIKPTPNYKEVNSLNPSIDTLIATIDLILFCDKWQISTMMESNLQYFYHSILLCTKEQLSPITNSKFLNVLKRLFDLIIDYGLGINLHYEIIFPPLGCSLANRVKMVICCHLISLFTWIVTKSDWLQGDNSKEKFEAIKRFIFDCVKLWY